MSTGDIVKTIELRTPFITVRLSVDAQGTVRRSVAEASQLVGWNAELVMSVLRKALSSIPLAAGFVVIQETYGSEETLSADPKP